MFKKRKKKALTSTIETEITTNFNKENLAFNEPDSVATENLLVDTAEQLATPNSLQKTLLEYELEDYEQVIALAERLIAGENLIVNVSNLEKIERKRVLEFLGGVIYVLQGKAKKVTDFGYVFITNYEK